MGKETGRITTLVSSSAYRTFLGMRLPCPGHPSHQLILLAFEGPQISHQTHHRLCRMSRTKLIHGGFDNYLVNGRMDIARSLSFLDQRRFGHFSLKSNPQPLSNSQSFGREGVSVKGNPSFFLSRLDSQISGISG